MKQSNITVNWPDRVATPFSEVREGSWFVHDKRLMLKISYEFNTDNALEISPRILHFQFKADQEVEIVDVQITFQKQEV